MINRKRLITDSIYIIFGVILIVIGINSLMLPNKITTGGVAGIATIIYYLFKIDLGITIFLINLPLFIIAIIKLGVKFSLKTIITTVLLSVFLDLFKFQVTGVDLFISSIFGGLLVGLGISFIFKAEASSGGSDLLAQIIHKKYTSINLSMLIFLIDFVIVLALVMVFNDIMVGFYCLTAIYVSKKIIDFSFEGIGYVKVVNIITLKHEDIIKEIIEKLKRGATYSKIKGGYLNKEYINVMCILTTPEVYKLKNIVKKIDKTSLIYITKAEETIGEGFKEF